MINSRMLVFVIFTAMVFLASSVAAQNADDLTVSRRNLMPVPTSVAWKDGRLPVTKAFTTALARSADERLSAYIYRAMRRLEGRTVFELSRQPAASSAAATLIVDAAAPSSAVPTLGADESYALDVTPSGAKIAAPTAVGAMRGIETLLQLLESDKDGFYFPAVSITDRPRFAWRGLMIDSARHFQPVEVIKRNLDGMAAVKLNVLHWHLTDDQGFRVETKKLPELAAMGSDGQYYTQAEISDVIRYAADRGIRVVPEFDIPGHATSWVVSHPEIASAPGPYKIERLPGIFNPTLDPTNPKTYKLLTTFFTEMAGLFPDAYIHIGGDENEGKQWDANPKIQAFMKKNALKTNHELQTYFNKKILKVLQKNGKKMMGWDEIFQPDLPKDVVIQSWRGQKALADAARQGFQGILSNGYYIDLSQPASQHYASDPIPTNTTLSADEQKRVLGGEATMWSEWVSPETIDSRIWPRTAAIAERLWSAQSVNDVDDMYRRLGVIERNLEELGLTHLKNQPMMLRRLARSGDTTALATLVSVIEPVKEYRRYQQRPQTMLSPLTGLIDAARPDAPGARAFNLAVDDLLAGRSDAAALRSMISGWNSAQNMLRRQMETSAGLFEARQLAYDLASLAAIATEALESIEAKQPRGAVWRDAKQNELAAIAKRKAALEFAIMPGIVKLVNVAGGN